MDPTNTPIAEMVATGVRHRATDAFPWLARGGYVFSELLPPALPRLSVYVGCRRALEPFTVTTHCFVVSTHCFVVLKSISRSGSKDVGPSNLPVA